MPYVVRYKNALNMKGMDEYLTDPESFSGGRLTSMDQLRVFMTTPELSKATVFGDAGAAAAAASRRPELDAAHLPSEVVEIEECTKVYEKKVLS